jgi:hypothetical protein
MPFVRGLATTSSSSEYGEYSSKCRHGRFLPSFLCGEKNDWWNFKFKKITSIGDTPEFSSLLLNFNKLDLITPIMPRCVNLFSKNKFKNVSLPPSSRHRDNGGDQRPKVKETSQRVIQQLPTFLLMLLLYTIEEDEWNSIYMTTKDP